MTTMLLLVLCVVGMAALRSAARGTTALGIVGWLALAVAWILAVVVRGPERGLVDILLLTGAGAILVVLAAGVRRMLDRSES